MQQKILHALLTCFITIVTWVNSNAQYVAVPDSNFVVWLKSNGYSQCMNGNMMDTTCPAIVNATSVFCYNAGISNLDGIQYFDNLASLAPSTELGLTWPPKGIIPLSVYSVPLLNTVILLTRGITVTWAHHSIINNFFNKSVVSLAITVGLGAYFIAMQYAEYIEARFAIADGVYGSTFFIATGFHGIHVTIGALFLRYVLIALLRGQLLYNHHFSFEAAA